MTGARPNWAARRPATSATSGITSSSDSCSASSNPSAACSASVYANPTFGPGLPNSPPAGCGDSRSPGRTACQREAGGSAAPGGRFCCCRGLSAGSAGTNGSVGTFGTLLGRIPLGAAGAPQQSVVDRVEQRLPRRLDDVLVHADR